eukprot:3981996-Amphidinium_carterae.1
MEAPPTPTNARSAATWQAAESLVSSSLVRLSQRPQTSLTMVSAGSPSDQVSLDTGGGRARADDMLSSSSVHLPCVHLGACMRS